jgi:ankyrin repeat protein
MRLSTLNPFQRVSSVLEQRRSRAQDQQGFMSAISTGNEASVRGFLARFQRGECNLDLNKKDGNGKTPLYDACERGHTAIVRLLLAVPKKNNDGSSHFSFFQSAHNDKLPDYEVNINKFSETGNNAFHIACRVGHVAIVQLLLADPRLEVNKVSKVVGNRATAFYFACSRGHWEIVQLLLAHPQVDVNLPRAYDRETPFFAACENNHVTIVDLLLADRQVNVNLCPAYFKQTPFFIACREGHTDVVRSLLNSGKANTSKPDHTGFTPFDIALEMGHDEIVRLLEQALKKNSRG